jgi:hypothetical protein
MVDTGAPHGAVSVCYSARRLTPYRRRTLTPDIAV